MKEALRIFKALGDETRLKIIESLLDGEKCVCEVVPHIGRTQSTVSIQLTKLEDLGIVESRRVGKSVYYRIVNDRVRQILDIVNEQLKVVEHASIIKYRPIGIVHSPFKRPNGTPIQSTAAKGIEGTVEIFPEYAEGLEGLEGFSHVILLYHFHLSKRSSLKVVPYMDDRAHGVFSTRAPSRPNPLGMSVLRLVGINGRTLHVQDVDIVDGTPLLDIKPYVPEFDLRNTEKVGWLRERVHKLQSSRDDGRFGRYENAKR